jgi:hypothetical protein
MGDEQKYNLHLANAMPVQRPHTHHLLVNPAVAFCSDVHSEISTGRAPRRRSLFRFTIFLKLISKPEDAA